MTTTPEIIAAEEYVALCKRVRETAARAFDDATTAVTQAERKLVEAACGVKPGDRVTVTDYRRKGVTFEAVVDRFTGSPITDSEGRYSVGIYGRKKLKGGTFSDKSHYLGYDWAKIEPENPA